MSNFTPEEQKRILDAADRILTLMPLGVEDLIDHLAILGALAARGVSPIDLLQTAMWNNPILLSHLLDELDLGALSELLVSKGQLHPPRLKSVESIREALKRKMQEWGIDDI